MDLVVSYFGNALLLRQIPEYGATQPLFFEAYPGGHMFYGCGGADDGYAMFGALAAIAGLADQRVPHARCPMLIEACEESGR